MTRVEGIASDRSVGRRAAVARSVLAAFLLPLLLALGACGSGSFSIEGTWKSIGDTGWGQAQPGALVQFSDGQANLYSPQDTYAFGKDGDDYVLEVTGLLGGTSRFLVTVVDKDNIELRTGADSAPSVTLKRVG